MIESLRSKNVLLTGASGGIGESLALEFAKAGCNLFLTGRDSDKLKILKNKVAKMDSSIDVFSAFCDLEKDLESLVLEVRDTIKTIDILVNCAGVFVVKPMRDTSTEDFDACFNVNVKAPYFLSKVFSSDMVERKWGRIVNIGSSSSYNGFKETSLYCSSKHALLGLSRSIYDELKEHNIKTFCFSPGSVKTEMGKRVKNQDYSTFIDPIELSKYIVLTISFDSDMIAEELRINRFNL